MPQLNIRRQELLELSAEQLRAKYGVGFNQVGSMIRAARLLTKLDIAQHEAKTNGDGDAIESVIEVLRAWITSESGVA